MEDGNRILEALPGGDHVSLCERLISLQHFHLWLFWVRSFRRPLASLRKGKRDRVE